MQFSLNTWKSLVVASSLLLTKNQATATSSNTKLSLNGHLKDLPDTGREWVTLADGGEFRPAEDFDLSLLDDEVISQQLRKQQQDRHLMRNSNNHAGYSNQFQDGSATYYNDYAQAWRLLGFYIDCNAPLNNVNECYDEGGDNNNEDGSSACQRYLLWAAVRQQSSWIQFPTCSLFFFANMA